MAKSSIKVRVSVEYQQDLLIELLNNTNIFRTTIKLDHNNRLDLEEWAERARESLIPTAKGKENYEPDGFYEGYACTCKEDCPSTCKGACGCQACQACYADHRPS